jgi:putative endonuclease
MFFVYILRSQSTGRLYKGSTEDLLRRMAEHAQGLSFSTKSGGPWELVRQEQFATRAEAMHRERYFKTGKGREELRKMLVERGTRSSTG